MEPFSSFSIIFNAIAGCNKNSTDEVSPDCSVYSTPSDTASGQKIYCWDFLYSYAGAELVFTRCTGALAEVGGVHFPLVTGCRLQVVFLCFYFLLFAFLIRTFQKCLIMSTSVNQKDKKTTIFEFIDHARQSVTISVKISITRELLPAAAVVAAQGEH